MIAGCVETTFRKLSGSDVIGSIEAYPVTMAIADHISRDWTFVFRNHRDLLKSPPGPVSNQRLENIKSCIRNLDSSGISRIFDVSRFDSGFLNDLACNGCMRELKFKSKSPFCVICGKQFCLNCIKSITVTIPSMKPFNDVSCCVTCARYLLRLQLDLDPWYNCSESSRRLHELESRATQEHTQLCARMSNFEGLVRFFVENKDKIPRADLIGPLPDIEKSIRAGISNFSALQRDIDLIECAPLHKDEQIRKCLSNFVTYHLTRIKSQFSVSSKLYERLMTTRGFSPASRPASPSPPRLPGSARSTPPPIDLDSL